VVDTTMLAEPVRRILCSMKKLEKVGDDPKVPPLTDTAKVDDMHDATNTTRFYTAMIIIH
jgi:hypothetical protein